MPTTPFRYIEPFSRNYDFKKGQQIFKLNLKFMTSYFAQRTRLRTIKNLPMQRIWKRLSVFYSRNRWTYRTHFFNYSIFFSKTNQ